MDSLATCRARSTTDCKSRLHSHLMLNFATVSVNLDPSIALRSRFKSSNASSTLHCKCDSGATVAKAFTSSWSASSPPGYACVRALSKVTTTTVL